MTIKISTIGSQVCSQTLPTPSLCRTKTTSQSLPRVILSQSPLDHQTNSSFTLFKGMNRGCCLPLSFSVLPPPYHSPSQSPPPNQQVSTTYPLSISVHNWHPHLSKSSPLVSKTQSSILILTGSWRVGVQGQQMRRLLHLRLRTKWWGNRGKEAIKVMSKPF
jgi:hypothetical protein